MIVRKAEAADFEAIDAYDIFASDRRADVEHSECYVAVEKERVSGYIVFNHSFFLLPFIQFLCVDSDFRQMGYAGKLLDYAEQACDGDKLFTSTDSNNFTMLKMFDKTGCRVSGLIENIQEKSEIVFCKKVRRTP